MSCPICAKPSDPKMRPFCSKRCADIDLGNWFGERYAIPDTQTEPEDLPDDASETTRH